LSIIGGLAKEMLASHIYMMEANSNLWDVCVCIGLL